MLPCRDGIDLNRALPDRSDPDSAPSLPTKGSEPPEILAMTKLATALPLAGAASLHEGAVVAIIPWDGAKNRQPGYAAAPDDETFKFLARTYAQANTRMAVQRPREGLAPNKVRPCSVHNAALASCPTLQKSDRMQQVRLPLQYAR